MPYQQPDFQLQPGHLAGILWQSFAQLQLSRGSAWKKWVSEVGLEKGYKTCVINFSDSEESKVVPDWHYGTDTDYYTQT